MPNKKKYTLHRDARFVDDPDHIERNRTQHLKVRYEGKADYVNALLIEVTKEVKERRAGNK